MNTIEEKVKKIIAETLGVNMDEISDETAIGDLPAWDSLNHLKIIATIENDFNIRFTPDIMMDLEDVSDIVNATEERVK